jgi:hypothetical protein
MTGNRERQWAKSGVRWLGDDTHSGFGEMCCDVTARSLVTKVWVKFFTHFHAVTAVCGIDCLVCQDEFFVNNPLDIEENVEHGLEFAVHLSHLFFVCPELNMPLNTHTDDPR